MAHTGRVRIGISGWRYTPWRGVFYPKGLRQRDELRYAGSRFPTVEINGTFYSLQRPESFAQWAAETPEDFVFAVKGPRYLTHMLKLNNPGTPLANFFANGLFLLGPKLGPILWQFPPAFRFNPERIESFLARLPRDTGSAAKLARKHDARVKGRTALAVDVARPLRYAVEIRHDSFRDPAFIALLRKYEVALVCADTVAWPRLMDLTADFIYCRLHGSEVLYASGYDDPALRTWATRVRAWAGGREPARAEKVIRAPAPKRPGRDVYVYFDNDIKVRAPFDAERLAQFVKH